MSWVNWLFLVFTWRHQILEFKTGRPTKFLPSFKERLPKNMSVHNFLARCRASFWKWNSFNFLFSIVRDIRRTAMTELFRILKMTLRVTFSILNNLSLRGNINQNIRKFTCANKPLFWQKWTPDVFSYFRPPCLCPSDKHGVSILSSINLCGTFCQITQERNAAQTWHLERCLIYSSSIPCQFLDFIHGMVSIFVFNGVTVKTENFAIFPITNALEH